MYYESHFASEYSDRKGNSVYLMNREILKYIKPTYLRNMIMSTISKNS